MSTRYYVEFEKSCDSVLAQHPVGTNQFIEVAVTDQSLPKIIRDAHPFRIVAGSNRFWMLAGGLSHSDGYGISWEPQDEAQSKVWVLSTTSESQNRIVHVAKR